MATYRLPREDLNPPLMAIGDSMYQGVRSLTMSAPLFRYAPPAQVARALGLGPMVFSVPDPLRPIIIDMEAFVRALPDLGRINDLLEQNARYWTKGARPSSPSGRVAFENASVASMDITDLYDFNWDLRTRQADALTYDHAKSIHGLRTVSIPGPDAQTKGSLGDAILGLNARFTLNPMGRPDLEGIQPVDLVKIRQPETLLVNIGSNEGLFDAGFEARPTLTAQKVADIRSKYQTLADHLKEVGPNTRAMVFNTLVLPSQVPNLMPTPESISYDGKLPGPSGYFDLYENRMGFGYGTLTADQLKQQDGFVQAINDAMADVMRSTLGNRAVIVDLAAQMKHLNRKHERLSVHNTITVTRKKALIFKETFHISNMMIEEGLGNAFRWGGFCGLDGMHPSVVGYGKIADLVVQALGRGTGRIDYDRCFREDTLLSDLPWLWTEVMFLWRDIRRATATPQTEEEKDKAAVMAVAAQALRR